MQVLELTRGERIEIEILSVLVLRVQQGRQQDGTDGTDRPGQQYVNECQCNMSKSNWQQLRGLSHHWSP